MLYYKGLIEMRKAYDIFTANSAEVALAEETGSGLLVVTFVDGKGGEAMVIINPHNTNLPCEIKGEWNLVANGDQAGEAVIERASGSVTVAGISLSVFVNDALVK